MQEGYEKEVSDFIARISIKDYYKALAKSIQFLGKVALELGQLQRDPVAHLFLKPPPRVTIELATLLGKKTIEEIEEEKVGPLLKALSNIPPASRDILDVSKTTSEAKIEFGEKTIAIAKKIEEILE